VNYRSTLVRRPQVPSDPQRRSLLVTGAVAVVASLVVVLWWSWPSLAGHDEQLDVLVVAEGELLEARRSMDLRVRQTGQSLEWIDLDPSWCGQLDELVAQIEASDPGRIVLSATGTCLPALLDRLPDEDPVLVPVPGTTSTPEFLAGLGDTVVDPVRLIGSRTPGLVFPCEWWDRCAEGVVVVRDETGALTPDGGERLARLVVAAL
jgi:hypothetical protein